LFFAHPIKWLNFTIFGRNLADMSAFWSSSSKDSPSDSISNLPIAFPVMTSVYWGNIWLTNFGNIDHTGWTIRMLSIGPRFFLWCSWGRQISKKFARWIIYRKVKWFSFNILTDNVVWHLRSSSDNESITYKRSTSAVTDRIIEKFVVWKKGFTSDSLYLISSAFNFFLYIL